MTKSRIIIGIIALVLLLGGVGIGVYLTQQQQDPRQRAEEPSVTPTLAACVPNEASCEWDATATATSYHYTVTETESGSVVTEGDVTAPTTKITFTTQDNKTYRCSVYAINACGQGEPGVGESACTVSPTPTPTGTPMPTPTGTPSPTPTNTPTPTVTPTPTIPVSTPTPTATPTPLPTSTPVPTGTPVATNTPTNTPTPAQQIVAGPTNTPTPTIEAPGSILQTVTIAGGIILTIIGALVLFVL